MRVRRGFTLIELVVSVGIVAVVTTVATMALRGARRQARVIECAHNLRQVWSALSAYAQDHYALLPAGGKTPNRLPIPTAQTLTELLGGRIEQLYCRTYPLRGENLKAWKKACADNALWSAPCIGYLYLAGSRFDGWDVANDALPDDFKCERIESVGQGLAYSADVVWLTDVARCTTNDASGRTRPMNWELTSHPPQRVVLPDPEHPEKRCRSDYRLPDGANVLFEDGHVLFRPFGKLRPRLIKDGKVYYW